MPIPVSNVTIASGSRSLFVRKLHHILALAEHPAELRWTGPDTFEITVDDAGAILALSRSWEFKSLSSFVRQLSYYGFKRLSDRRRSHDRLASSNDNNYIVFGHPSGSFTQNSSHQELASIGRRVRTRKAVATPPAASPPTCMPSPTSSLSTYEDFGSSSPEPCTDWMQPVRWSHPPSPVEAVKWINPNWIKTSEQFNPLRRASTTSIPSPEITFFDLYSPPLPQVVPLYTPNNYAVDSFDQYQYFPRPEPQLYLPLPYAGPVFPPQPLYNSYIYQEVDMGSSGHNQGRRFSMH